MRAGDFLQGLAVMRRAFSCVALVAFDLLEALSQREARKGRGPAVEAFGQAAEGVLLFRRDPHA
jgi:hypothetical protein